MTGVVSNDMNGVVSAGTLGRPEQLIDELIAWFIDHAVPASWLASTPDPRLTGALVERGARPELSGWWAGRVLDRSTHLGTAADAAIRRVRSHEDLDGWLEVAEGCGWIDGDHDRAARAALYRRVGLDHPHLRHWIATRGHTPIGMATSFLDGDVLDLCNLAVVEAERRHGVGTALVHERLLDGNNRLATLAVAALSPDGWALYEPIGFNTAPVVANTWFYLPLTQS